MKKNSNKFLLVILLFLINSCNLDNFDFNKLSDDIDLSPEFVMPLANADISMWDIIESVNDENDTLIKVGNGDIIKIVYTEEGIYNYQVSDLIDIPQTKTFNSGSKAIGTISVDNISISRKVTLWDLTDAIDGDIDNIIPLDGTSQPEFPSTNYDAPPEAEYTVEIIDKFNFVELQKGTLEVTLLNSLDAPVTVQGYFFDTQYSQTIANISFSNLDPQGTQTITATLDGMTISNQIVFRMTKFQTIANGQPTIIDLDDYFNLDLNFKDLKVSSGSIKTDVQVISGFSGSFEFVFDDDAKIFEAILKEGFIDITSSNNSQLTGTINLTLPEMKKGNDPIEIQVPFNGNSITQNLDNAVINLASDINTPYNQVPYEYSITVNESDGYIDFNSTESVSLDIYLTNLDFQSLKGDFGNRNEAINIGSFNMDMEFLDKISGDFVLENPQIKLILTNGIGMPAEVAANFTAQNKEGQSVSLDPETFTILTPANLGDPAIQQTITIDKSNSNIVNFIALPPSGDVNYFGNINFNPEGTVNSANPNFFDLDASLQIDLGVDLPFELKVNNLTFSDTATMDSGDLDMIKTAELTINAVNEIPLDIGVQLFFIDTISGQQYSSSAESKLLDAAQISNEGVITPTTSSNTISLSESELEGLKDANGIVIKGTISSPEDGAKTAVIYSESKLNINVVIKSEIDL